MQLNDTINQLKSEKRSKKQIQKNLSVLKTQYDANIHFNQLCKQMIFVKENMEDEMLLFKKQIQTEFLSIKGKQFEYDLNIVKQKIENEIQKNNQIEDEIAKKNQVYDIEMQKNKLFEEELSLLNKNISENTHENEQLENEISYKKRMHEIKIQKTKQLKEEIPEINKNISQKIQENEELEEEITKKNQVYDIEIQKNKLFEEELSLLNKNISKKTQENEQLENEISNKKQMHEIEIQKTKQLKEELPEINKNISQKILENEELEEEITKKNQVFDIEIQKNKQLKNELSVVNRNINKNIRRKTNSFTNPNGMMEMIIMVIITIFFIFVSTICIFSYFKTFKDRSFINILTIFSELLISLLIFCENTNITYFVKFILFAYTLLYILYLFKNYGPSKITNYLFIDIFCKCYFITSDTFNDYLKMIYVILFAIEIYHVYFIYENRPFKDVILILLADITIFFVEINFDASYTWVPHIAYLLNILFSYNFLNKKATIENSIFFVYSIFKYACYNIQLSNIFHYIFYICDIFLLLQCNDTDAFILASIDICLSLFYINVYRYVLFILFLSVFLHILFYIGNENYILSVLSLLKYICFIYQICFNYGSST